MPILVDSDVLIEISRGRDFALIENWKRLSNSEDVLMCSPVTVAELWHGARPHEYPILEALFSALMCVPIDEQIGRAAGGFLRQYSKSHHLELGDALIAGTASVHGAALWTRNRKHYPMKKVRFYGPPPEK